MNPNIIIVEDNPIISLDLTSYIKKLGYTQVFSCMNEAEAQALLLEIESGFVFLDINLDNKYTGINIAKSLASRTSFPFAYITANTDAQTLEELKGTHPVGFIVKPFKEEEVKAILILGCHQLKHPHEKPDVDESTIAQLFSELTKTERKVMLGLYKGDSNQEIADQLFVSTNTIKTHLKSIFVKLDVNSRLKAVQMLLSKL